MIYIVTACSRPENLPKIYPTIPKQCTWVIVYDNRIVVPQIDDAIFLVCENTGNWGIKAQNFALDNLVLTDNDFVLLLDDDNIIHPAWYNSIKSLLKIDFSVMTWGQLTKHGEKRVKPTKNPDVGNNCDTGSFLISWKYNKNVRHIEDLYYHDGLYANQCAKNGRVLVVNKYIAYYNYL